MASRHALLIVTDSYGDAGLDRLQAPAGDAARLAELLRDPEIGRFDGVTVLENEPEHVIRRRLGTAFGDRSHDDLFLLYLAGHGVKQGGNLYFATADTELSNLDATAVSAEFVTKQLHRSRCRRVVMLLDCCYSGAFARGMVPRSGDDDVELYEAFGAKGRAVLTASTSTEQAFEAGEPQGEGRAALFTDAVIRGLETGEADVNNDGRISIGELHEYVTDSVRARNPDQTPTLWQFETEGEMLVAWRRSDAALAPPEHWFADDPRWFKRAVFYDVRVPSFFDGNGDGIGDLRGLTEKLDYLQWLGVDCLALSPLYAHAGDELAVTDHYAVHSDLGSVDDLRALVDAAHERGIRLVTDLVMSQTSVEHPWFRGRAGEGGSASYIWSETGTEYADAQSFDGQPGWTWDQEAGAYYWHRHGPDLASLNYDDPEVHEAMLNVARWWLDLGFDGLRLRGAEELYAREGTNCLNLPESIVHLQHLRATIDEEYPQRVLIARTVAHAEDALMYLGSDETPAAHMVMSYWLPPALLTAMRREHATMLQETFERAGRTPHGSAWAAFLRDDQQVRLDVVLGIPSEVTDVLASTLTRAPSSDLLLGEYARDPQMIYDGGIRRRLAPLLDSSRDAQELAMALILTAPASPFVYYGDEIGMGDNVYLQGVDGLRTPMQWTADRNGGFSLADPAQLVLPPVADPVYGHQAVNVEAQLRTPSSFLRFVRRLIAARKEEESFASDGFDLLSSGNPAVLAFVREGTESRALCVFNLSRRATPAALELCDYAGLQPVDLLGHDVFPTIGSPPYVVTMAPHGFFIFRLVEPAEPLP